MSDQTSQWLALDQPQLRDRLAQLMIPASLLQSHWAAVEPEPTAAAAVLEWSAGDCEAETLNNLPRTDCLNGVVQLRPLDKALGNPVSVDFLHGKTGFRALRFQHEMIVKAVAGRSKEALTVVDATAGLGRDGFLLAAAGFTVTAIERHPAIACLLADGLDRAMQDADMAAICHRISLEITSAHHYLASLASDQQPDVICLDPMFPERSKTALVKKEMRIFRDVVGEDDDAGDLLELALQAARKRVVVKRPRKADAVGKRKPGYQLLGKSSRFDIYVVG